MGKLDYTPFLKEANAFTNSATKAFISKKLNNQVLYGIVTIAIEKHFMSLLMSKGIMPASHTLEDLFIETKTVFPLKEDLHEDVVFTESFMELCSFEPAKDIEITNNDMARIILTLEKIADLSNLYIE